MVEQKKEILCKSEMLSFWFGLNMPQSTVAMVMSGRSVHLITLFPGQA